MTVLAIDPGSTESAFVVWGSPLEHGKLDNDDLLFRLRNHGTFFPGCTHLAIEMAQSFGAKVWSQVFTTVLWTGRFVEAWTDATGLEHTLMSRLHVKTHVTGSARARDGQVRQCLLDRYGGKDAAVGTKQAPGPLRGVTADRWAALAIAVAWSDAQLSPTTATPTRTP